MRKRMMSNRTGCAIAPELSEQMVEGAREFPPTSAGDAEGLGAIRAGYTKGGEPIGTMPPPASLKGAAKTAAKALAGAGPMQLLDQLGERLAFEKAGTRLWEALIAKLDATGGFSGGPSREQLAHIRDEELQHFEMLQALIERMDADPTAVTPGANVQAVASKGLPAVLTDPRTDLVQCLEAVLVAELVDNDCWPALIELLSEAGQTEDAQGFLCAVEAEREHLQCVRMWLAAAQGRSVDAMKQLSQAGTETVMAMPAIASLGAGGSSRGGRRTAGQPGGHARAKPARGRVRSARPTAKARPRDRQRPTGGKAAASRTKPKARTTRRRGR